ncbi:MAG TPA: DUF3313 family protein [Steroidobacteraceae bacterium]|jgi:hypothetical protein|nr:DUF3313 family protein [Steroidobacteraceae bacterium]
MTSLKIAGARSTAKHLSLALLAIGAVAALLPAVAADEPPTEWDGLARVSSKKLDHLYKLPEADFSGYKRVRLDPIEVEFDKNWKPNASERSPSRRLTNSDLEKIKKTLAEEFRKVFTEELTEHGYPVVNEDGDEVLRVSAAIINLYITAPDTMSAGRSRTYTTNTGHMTLVAELRDSVTGKLMARAVDSVQARNTGTFMITTSVTNLGDARTALSKWAGELREGLDDATGRSK